MVEMGEWSIVVRVSRVVSPFWFIFNGLVGLNIKTIIHIDVVWAGFTMIEMGEWTIVIGIAGVMAPLRFIGNRLSGLDIKAIITSNVVWASLAVIKVIGWAIIIRAARVVSPFRLVLLALGLFVNMMVMMSSIKLDSLRRSQKHGHSNCILHDINQ
jgi:hypothetical protein